MVIMLQQILELSEALNSKIKPEDDVTMLNGSSSPKVRALLNNLCDVPNTSYLELGVWRGSTFISALYGNEHNVVSAVGIDDFSSPTRYEFREYNLLAHRGSLSEMFYYINRQDSHGEFLKFKDRFLSNYKGYFNFIVHDALTLDLGKHTLFLPKTNLVVHYDMGSDINKFESFLYQYDIILPEKFTLAVSSWNDIGDQGFNLIKKLFKVEDIVKCLTYPETSEWDNWWKGIMVCRLTK